MSLSFYSAGSRKIEALLGFAKTVIHTAFSLNPSFSSINSTRGHHGRINLLG